jgi:hypothetical protein
VRIQKLARKSYKLWKKDPNHPSIDFKQVSRRNPVFSVRVGLGLRALGMKRDETIAFDDLCRLLLRLGFVERKRGSHHTFRREGIEEKINLQRDNGKAKAYQVRQVRAVILKYKLGGDL